jgi:prepilin-type N-terminal cleavage/methylation domain-containing protein/prepilin-type processing-associated H-X9-DG protein
MRDIFPRVRRTSACLDRGFTLVELLIVISIIALLIAMIMPAVNSARETGRRAYCSNNCKQMAAACLQHESKYGFLPTGGWGYMWAGDPDRGYHKQQPGGWHYNILPFIDEQDLHDMGSGSGGKWPVPAAAVAQAVKRAQTPVAIYLCPTRHGILRTFPYSHPAPFNVPAMSTIAARSDYAADGGDEADGGNLGGDLSDIIQDYPTGDSYQDAVWNSYPGGAGTPTVPLATGPIFLRSECTLAMIKDGPTFTYLLGERFLNPDAYYTGSECDNDQGWDLGFDYDTNRWTYFPPSQDRAGISDCYKNFGSAHMAGFNMAFCDGHVQKMNYEIDPTVHQQLGNRLDGEPTDWSKINGGKGD